MGNIEHTTDPWEMASVAKVHLQQMDDLHEAGNDKEAEAEFETAWQLLSIARDAFLEEMVAKHAEKEDAA